MASKLTGFSKFLLSFILVGVIALGFYILSVNGISLPYTYSPGDCIERISDGKKYTVVDNSEFNKITVSYDDIFGVEHQITINKSVMQSCK